MPESEVVAAPASLVMQRERQAIGKQEQQTVTCPAHWFRSIRIKVVYQ